MNTTESDNLRENNTGYISEINGSLVTVKGIENQVRLHDLIKIPKYNIIGEVIQIYKNRINVQCYEPTDNLRLKEEVQYLYEPLSMELGPGLLSNVFDGIQRPLDKIFREEPSGFIRRGLDIPALTRDKQWHFKPLQKRGSKIQGGDVVGVVQETEAITHYILVPPNVQGSLTSIKKEGDYTINETIYEVEYNKKKHSYSMMQKWPVTKRRPFKKRLPLNNPLITGQRVVDLLFPIAKGGTVAVPGGFGTGKCVVGETPILLANGSLIKIKELYKFFKNNNKGEIKINTPTEKLISIKDNLEILSFNGTQLKKKNATHIYQGKTKQILKIETKTGRCIQLTPIHKLHIFDGIKISEIEGKDLKEGDFIVVPRKIEISGKDTFFNAYQMDDSLRVIDKLALSQMKTFLDSLEKTNNIQEIAERLKIDPKTLINYWKGINNPTIEFFKQLNKTFGFELINIRIIKAQRQSPPFKIPEKLTKELSEWLGLFIADGHIKGKQGGIFLFNASKQILNRFSELTNIIFDLEAVFGQDSETKTPYMVIRNKSLRQFLYSLGIPKNEKSKKIRIPNCVLNSPEAVLIHFLNGYFAGDGWFSQYTVGFSTASINLHIDTSYLLTRLGLLYRVSYKKNSYVIELEGKWAEKLANILRNIDIFKYDKLNSLFIYSDQSVEHFDSLDVMPYNKEIFKKIKNQGRDPLAHNAFRKFEGIRLDNYIKRNQRLTKRMFKKISNTIEKYNLKIDKEIVEHINYILDLSEILYFDEIKTIKIINKATEVYDLTVEDTHNFIGGFQPFILHNTVLQQSIAKWSDADIIVFVSCGERGNEVADLLRQFPKLTDPRTGRPLLERTILITNTSNMPVSAREASIFSGITIAEYYRDMGYNVALQADSTSRWAEALREISGLLEEMPAEGGYPAYLPSRLSGFYERAGIIETLGGGQHKHNHNGSLTVIGSVSPPAGDFSEPVTSNTKRFVQAFWALDAELAYEKHYPAINWIESYSNYPEYIKEWWKEEVHIDWMEIDLNWFQARKRVNQILSQEHELKNMTQLIGEENLPEQQQLDLFTAGLIKDAFLIQNAFDEIDTFTSPKKMLALISLILLFYQEGKNLLNQGYLIKDIKELDVINRFKRIKNTIPNEEIIEITEMKNELLKQIESLRKSYGVIR
ncbi:MAG: V-type ATP synthase alpha chain [Promethearchaeota archaeon]|nr:MAG: V-type ATP synthase alpha chain [Candidatus Lokiarchaeota archaeon]